MNAFPITRGALLLVLALAVAGCAPKKDAAETRADRPRIALVMKSLANEFFLTMQRGAEAHQKENASRYDLLADGIKDERDVARQQQLVEQMVAQEVDALVIAPADSKALAPAIKKALDAGVVVVNIDNRFDAAALRDLGISVPFVGPDNRKGARAVAERLAASLKAHDPVAILEGVPTAFNAQERKAGFEEGLKAADLKVVASQSAHWETDEASKVAGAILSAHPDLKALLCANDSMALGAVAALRAAGRLGSVQVVGFDNIAAVRDLVKGGTVLATADQHADRLAVYGIETALEILEKKTKPADRETPVDLVTKESLATSK